MFLISIKALSQPVLKIDSLKASIKQLKEDTNKINTYLNIANAYNDNIEYDSAFIYTQAGIKLSRKSN